ncbi:MAG: glucose-6-phosphate isomerase [Odoribacteraceae bacterium]|jgi:glucose-6-phosphate isomerase|nr:glucose-6-phosphate isomerase [Odoribacteraceae bacterium]
MKQLTVDTTGASEFTSPAEIAELKQKAIEALNALLDGAVPGNEFLGWLRLPSSVSPEEIEQIQRAANDLRQRVEVVVVIGIGGSYLGAKAVIEALSGSFDALEQPPKVIFAGHHLGEEYHVELQRYLQHRSFGICVISKSGTTTEPAIAFRVLRALLEQQVGKREAARRVIAITDERRGALRQLADKEGYQTFPIPDNVGGRYSVLTPVGLLPVALAGFDVSELVKGAAAIQQRSLQLADASAIDYAVARNALYRKGYTTEITVNYNPRLHYLVEWWKQLYGESEGKQHLGIFPAGANFSTDLHSLGQFIQEGPRTLFETVISVEQTAYPLVVPRDPLDLDNLNFLAGKQLDQINKMAEQGTRAAHLAGGVPNLRLLLPALTGYHLGELLYFYQLACGISAGILGVNAFDQPGVEAYKKNMFALLGKPS